MHSRGCKTPEHQNAPTTSTIRRIPTSRTRSLIHHTAQLQAKQAAQEAVETCQVVKPSVWMPGCEMEEEETLDYDPTAYDCLTSFGL